MAFGSIDERRTAVGLLLTIPYDDTPAVKLELQAAGDRGGETVAALFWQGSADIKAIAHFVDGVQVDGLHDVWKADRPGVKDLLALGDRHHLHLQGTVGSRPDAPVAIWATLRPAAGGLTPEVGISVPAALLTGGPIETACKTLIESTFRWRHASPNEIDDLMVVITSRVARGIGPRALGLGAA